MATRLFIGNIPFKVTEDEIKTFFADYEVNTVSIIRDKTTQKPRGFAFVELRNDDDAADAIADLNGRELGGREARVSPATERPKSERPKGKQSARDHGW